MPTADDQLSATQQNSVDCKLAWQSMVSPVQGRFILILKVIGSIKKVHDLCD